MEKERDAKQTTDDELNATIAVVGDQVTDFLKRTDMHATHLIPAINSVGVKLLVKSRGIESAQLFYRKVIADFDSRGGIPVGSHIGMDKPPVAPENVAEVNAMLWSGANNMIAMGKSSELVAQAYSTFAMLLANRVGGGDPWLAKFLLAEAALELGLDLDASRANPNSAKQQYANDIQCPDNVHEPIKTLFDKFRDFVYLLTDNSNLEWEHLLPGLQAGAIVFFIMDRGKDRTLEFFEKMVADAIENMSQESAKEFPSSPITPLQITNMAKFNQGVIELGEQIVKETECPPVFVAHALSLLATTIAYRYFDEARCVALYISACENIRQGQYDEYM